MRGKDCAALILAAGAGTRFGGKRPKQFHPLGLAPLLSHTAQRIALHPAVTRLMVAVPKGEEARAHAMLTGLPVPLDVVAGGATRQESACLGLRALAPHSPAFVLIHDAARPCLSSALITRLLAALDGVEGVAPALPLADAVKRKSDLSPIRRDGWMAIQTPQAFRFGRILAAHRAAQGQDSDDDMEIARAAGLSVTLIAGERTNIKLTWKEDLMMAQALLASETPAETRIGTGFDVHAFGEAAGRVTLCGVHVPHERALEGHSDADVALHAITDALLGALGEGDIGRHFPPTDMRWKDAQSRLFLETARDFLHRRGGRITNIDATIICERPKIAPHAPAMRARLAEWLRLDPTRVNIKGTTTERLGFAGREEGIAALATVAVALPAEGGKTR